MSRYLIPNYKLPELSRQIQKIRNKGAQIIFDIIDPNVRVAVSSSANHYFLECSEIEVEGTYRINGWTFVGTIEHASPENIIRLVDQTFANRIPERYRHAGRECEHCGLRRDRNDTYLVYNEDADEFKQVGRTCLQSYTQGLNAETCAMLASITHSLQETSEDLQDDDFDAPAEYLGYDMNVAKKQAYKYVQDHGYVAGQTGKEFAAELNRNPNLPEATDAEIQAVTDWLATIQQSDWARNARAAWNKQTYQSRDGALIASAAAVYQRELAKRNEQEARNQTGANNFAGNVGDRVEVTIADVRVLYYRTGGSSYRPGSYPVYRIVGVDGKVYIWGCSSGEDLHIGDQLSGTIKRLNERPNGEKQTELTRCRVIEQGPHYRGFTFS